MGDRLSLHFFIEDNHTFNPHNVSIWFEDRFGKSVDIGDYYPYLAQEANKKSIKEDLKEHFPKKKGLYKEYKQLIDKMKEYESGN